MSDDVGSSLLKVQVWNLLGPCLCFLKCLCLNAGGGGGGGEGGVQECSHSGINRRGDAGVW